MARLRVDHAVVVRHLLASTARRIDVDNNIWVVGDDDECVVIDAPHDVDAILDVVGGPHGEGDPAAPTPTTTTARRPGAARGGQARRSCCTPTTGRCGSSPTPTSCGTSTSPTARRSRSRGAALKVLHTPGPRARCGLPLRARPRLRLHRRHPLPGRSGRHRPVVQRRATSSRTRSARSCSRCPTRRSCTPATATTPPSGPSGRRWPDAAPRRTPAARPGAGRLGVQRGSGRRAGRPAGGADDRRHHPAHPRRAAGPGRGLGADPCRAGARRAPGGPDVAARAGRAGHRRGVARHRRPGRRWSAACTWAGSSRSPTTSPRTGQIRPVNATLARAVRRPWPLFLSVDQEGGIVERVKGDATRFPTFMSAGRGRRPAAHDGGLPRQRRRAARDSASTSSSRRTPTSPSGPADPTIGSRSAGSDAPAGQPPRSMPPPPGSSDAGWCRCSSTSPATGRCRRQPPHPPGPDADPRAAARRRPGALRAAVGPACPR